MNSFPLSWPEGWPRTQTGDHKYAQFGKREQSASSRYQCKTRLTVADGVRRVVAELERMGVDRQHVIVSTNVRTRLDGLPRSGEREPEDSGAAVYWQERSGKRRVMAIDLYTKVADNLAAIAATLDAMRAIERHGGACILERAFTGFTALPPPAAKREWWDVLGIVRTASIDEIRMAYRRLANQHHPDKGGFADAMAEINAAYQQALEAK